MPAYNTNPPQFRNVQKTAGPRLDFDKARARLAAKKTVQQQWPTQQPEEVKQGFMSRLNSLIGARGSMATSAANTGIDVAKNIIGDYKSGGQRIIDTVNKTNAQDTGDLLRGGLRVVGTVAKTAFSPIVRPLEPLINKAADVLSDSKTVQKIASTDVVGRGLETIGKGFSKYEEWAKRNPELAGDIEDVVNIAMLYSTEKPVQKSLQTVSETIAKDINAVSRGVSRVGEVATNIRTKTPGLAKDAFQQGKDLIKPPKPIEGVVGEITGAKTTKDIAKSQKALTQLDTTGVKTYEDLVTRVKTEVGNLANKVDEVLAQDKTLYKPSQLVVSARTAGGQIIKTDYVSRALRHLEEIYTKSGEDLAAANIRETVNQYMTQGLTKLDINDLARVYGTDAPKGFSKLGDALTSVNAKASETIRSGLKEVARKGMDDTAKNLDMQISNLKTLEGYSLKMQEAVQNLTNRIEERGLVEKVGRALGKVVDVSTGGFVKSFFNKLLMPSNVGLKTLNSLDLEAKLAKNLQQIQKALKIDTDNGFLEAVKQIMKQEAKPREVKPIQFEQRSSIERSPIIKYIKNNPPNIGLSIRNVKAIDNLTKKEIIDIIDYIRLKKGYNQTTEDFLGYLAEKYNLKSKTPSKIADELEDLITKTKTTTVGGKKVKKNIEVKPKEDALITEARKYKSAEEFVNDSKQVFRGGEPFDASKTKLSGKGIGSYFSTDKKFAQSFADELLTGKYGKKSDVGISEFHIQSSAKILERKDFPKKFLQDYQGGEITGLADIKNRFGGPHGLQDTVAKWAIKNGYDVVDYSGSGKNLIVVNPEVLKTKSQLTDIWNKANKKKK